MRKSNLLFKLFLLTCVGVAIWYFDLIPTITTTIKLLKTQKVQTAVTTQKLQSELDKYKEQERKQKAEEERLKNITITKTINSEIKRNLGLKLVEGTSTYQMPFDKQGFISWFNNTLHLEIPYTYLVILDNSNIEVVDTENNVVTFEVSLALDYKIALNAQELKQQREKKFGVGFSEKDLQSALQIAETKVLEDINSNEEIQSAALQTLEEYLNNLAKMKGCTAEIIYE
jgi:hypothetical protein